MAVYPIKVQKAVKIEGLASSPCKLNLAYDLKHLHIVHDRLGTPTIKNFKSKESRVKTVAPEVWAVLTCWQGFAQHQDMKPQPLSRLVFI